MDDNLIPKPEANEGGNEASAKKKAADERPQDAYKDFPAPQGNDVAPSKTDVAIFGVILVALEALGIGLWQIADGISGHIGIFIHWLSLVSIFAGPMPAIREVIKPEKRSWFWIGCIIVWLILAVVAFIVWRPISEIKSKTRLDLILNTSHAPNDLLWMTNDFLIFSNRSLSSPFVSSETNAYLVISFSDGETNIVLNFIALNDPASDSTIDAPEISFTCPKNTVLSYDDKWETNGFPDSKHPSTILFFSTPDKALLPGSGFRAPQLAFDPKIAFANNTYAPDGWVNIRLRGKTKDGEVVERVLCFWMIFVPMPAGSTNLIRPKLIPPQNIGISRTKTNSTFLLKYP